MIRIAATLMLFAQISPALADQRIQMPDGGGCWMNNGVSVNDR